MQLVKQQLGRMREFSPTEFRTIVTRVKVNKLVCNVKDIVADSNIGFNRSHAPTYRLYILGFARLPPGPYQQSRFH